MPGASTCFLCPPPATGTKELITFAEDRSVNKSSDDSFKFNKVVNEPLAEGQTFKKKVLDDRQLFSSATDAPVK